MCMVFLASDLGIKGWKCKGNSQKISIPISERLNSTTSLQLQIMIMMTLIQQLQSLFYVTALITLLFTTTRGQSCNSQQELRNRAHKTATCNNRDNYYDSYGSCVSPGLKVVDSLRAQTKFIQSNQIRVS